MPKTLSYSLYHFQAAEKWGDELTDIIIASGNVYSGEKKITTSSGKYQPIVADLSGRDGWKHLAKIRTAVKKNDLSSLLELVFIPLYGKVTAAERSNLALEVLKFEREQLEAGNMDIKFLAATLIMTNKFIDKDKLNELWEVIKMLDVIELAMEKGKEEGRELAQEMILDTIYELPGKLPVDLIEKVKSISHSEILRRIHRQAMRCKNIEQFQDVLDGVA